MNAHDKNVAARAVRMATAMADAEKRVAAKGQPSEVAKLRVLTFSICALLMGGVGFQTFAGGDEPTPTPSFYNSSVSTSRTVAEVRPPIEVSCRTAPTMNGCPNARPNAYDGRLP